jgi:hypothetical protein
VSFAAAKPLGSGTLIGADKYVYIVNHMGSKDIKTFTVCAKKIPAYFRRRGSIFRKRN